MVIPYRKTWMNFLANPILVWPLCMVWLPNTKLRPRFLQPRLNYMCGLLPNLKALCDSASSLVRADDRRTYLTGSGCNELIHLAQVMPLGRYSVNSVVGNFTLTRWTLQQKVQRKFVTLCFRVFEKKHQISRLFPHPFPIFSEIAPWTELKIARSMCIFVPHLTLSTHISYPLSPNASAQT